MSTIRVLISLALAGSVAAAVYGFYDARLLAQPVWTEAGLRKLLEFSGAYIACFAVALLFKPGAFVPLVAVVALCYAAFALGPLALIAVALLLISSFAAGRSLLRVRANADCVLVMLLGVCVYMFVVSLAAFFPVNYAVVYWTALLAPIVANWREAPKLVSFARGLIRPVAGAPKEQLAWAALVFVLLFQLWMVLQPETGPDALAVHLVVPHSMATLHRWPFDFSHRVWAVMPLGADWCYAIVYMLGGETAAQLLNFSFFLALVALVVRTVRRFVPLATALLIGAAFAATPVAELVTGSLFAENLWALLVCGSLVALAAAVESRDGRDAYLAFLLLGSAASVKYGAFAFSIPVIIIAAVLSWRRAIGGSFAAAVVLFAVAAAPPYVTSYFKTGTPVYPFLGYAEAFWASQSKPRVSVSAPYDLTFHSGRFVAAQDGAAGFQYFLLLPAALLSVRRRWPAVAFISATSTVVFITVMLRVQPNLRYVYPAFAPLSIVIAAGMAEWRGSDRRLYAASLAICAAALCLDVYFLPSAGWQHKDFLINPASASNRARYVSKHAPVRNLIAYLNQRHDGEAVLFVETNASAGLHGRAFSNDWHSTEVDQPLLRARTPSDCLFIVRRHDIRHVVVAEPPRSTVLDSFVRLCAAPETRSGAAQLFRVKPGCAPISHVPAPVSPGVHDDIDGDIVYSGPWFHGHFGEAFHGTVTYSDSAGASFQVVFHGSEVTYTFTKAPNRGIADVRIDSRERGDLDLYSPKVEWQSKAVFECEQAGEHTIEVVVSGRKNTRSGGAYVDVDAVRVAE